MDGIGWVGGWVGGEVKGKWVGEGGEWVDGWVGGWGVNCFPLLYIYMIAGLGFRLPHPLSPPSGTGRGMPMQPITPRRPFRRPLAKGRGPAQETPGQGKGRCNR